MQIPAKKKQSIQFSTILLKRNKENNDRQMEWKSEKNHNKNWLREISGPGSSTAKVAIWRKALLTLNRNCAGIRFGFGDSGFVSARLRSYLAAHIGFFGKHTRGFLNHMIVHSETWEKAKHVCEQELRKKMKLSAAAKVSNGSRHWIDCTRTDN